MGSNVTLSVWRRGRSLPQTLYSQSWPWVKTWPVLLNSSTIDYADFRSFDWRLCYI